MTMILGSFLVALGMALFSNCKLKPENNHQLLSWFMFSWGKTTIVVASLSILAGSAALFL